MDKVLNPRGLCLCGCGLKTKIAIETRSECGWKAGQSIRYIHGHHPRKNPSYRVDENGCWIWALSVTGSGYGYYQNKLAHRLFYEKHKGKIPEGMEIDHLCRVRNCVNPKHLEAVTSTENNRRKRTTVLTMIEARKIRNLYASKKYKQKEIGAIYGIGQKHVSDVIHRRICRE